MLIEFNLDGDVCKLAADFEIRLANSILVARVREQLVEWFGTAVNEWRHLRTYSIPYSLPAQAPPALSVPERPVRWEPNVYVCGDHRDNASIQGAMASGRRAAEAVLRDFA
jgi:predicted NAD/FAD-dependent oxidoreductase